VKTNSEPDLNDLFSDLAYMTARFAAAKKDLASQLVFFLCAIETIYNLILDEKLDPTSFNPAEIKKFNETTGNLDDIEGQFNHRLDRVWESLMKQIGFRLETGSWYQLPIAPDKQFSMLYKLMVGDAGNKGSSNLAEEIEKGNGQVRSMEGVMPKRKPADGSLIKSKFPSMVGSNPQSPMNAKVPFQARKVSQPADEHRAAKQGKQNVGNRRNKKGLEQKTVESSRTALLPPLPNKTVRPRAGAPGERQRVRTKQAIQASQVKRHKAEIRPSKGTTGYLVLTDAAGDPMPEMYEYINETADHIVNALPNPSQWSSVVMYLLACLEANTEIHRPLDSALDNICRLITRRLNKGQWR